MEKYIPYKILLFLFLFSFFWSCSPTRYVGKDEYLLNRVKVKVNGNEVGVSDLKKAVRQHPNTRILGVARFHLGLYNLSGKNENKRFNEWLRSIGEAPVIYSPFLTGRSVGQLELYLQSKGYYKAVVKDSVWYRNRKAHVIYDITPGPLSRIEHFSFRSDTSRVVGKKTDNTALSGLVLADSQRVLIHPSMALDVELLEKERDRVTHLLRGNGYYNFSKDLIQYYADTTLFGASDKVNLAMVIENGASDSMAYRKYKIANIRVNLDYDPLLAANAADSTYERVRYGRYEIMYNGEMKINPPVILETIQFGEGEWYDAQKVTNSYSRLQALNLFKFINIVFKELRDKDGNPLLDCEILLTPMKRQSYNVFIEGTNNSGNIGVGGNFAYNHKNLFHGGENLTMSVWGALKKERLKEDEIFSTTEIGMELKMVTPQFWMPIFRLAEFRRDFAPRTSVSLSYSQENTQFYRRRIASAKFGYLWRRADNKWRYNFDLIDLNYVLMPFVNQDFIDGLKNQHVKSAYTDHMILSSNFSAVFTNQILNSPRNFSYFRGNVETSGNVLAGIGRLVGKQKEEEGWKYYEILGVPYARFVKFDGEYRYNQYINRANTMVYRMFLGCGYPYGNMKALPFEEAYYCGGANGIRAWQARRLGPGDYVSEDSYPNSVGDFKLEANVEYRFKLFWLLEGALFLDAGNIWNINRFENRPGAKLSADFYKQIAVGTGVGLRLDVTFFLLRFDMGIKMHDPMQPLGQRFVLLNNKGGFKESVFNIAIGYPF